MHFDRRFLSTALPNAEIIGDVFPAQPSIAVDSRKVRLGDIFVAIKGAQHNGHEFIDIAVENGCVGLLVAQDQAVYLNKINPEILNQLLIIIVPDTVPALVQLARAWRASFNYPVVGITGSVGKTSTKEILSQILKTAGVSHCVSKGNLNTLVGASISLLQMRAEHKVAIFEIGISQRGEMDELADLVRPTIGLITSVGHSHMDGLGLPADIAAEKRKIFKFFSESNIGIINGDQPLLANIAYTHPVVRFVLKTTSQIQVRKIMIEHGKISCKLKIYGHKFDLEINGTHRSRVFNSLAAAGVAYLLEVPIDKIIAGLKQDLALTGRMEQKQLKPEFGSGLLIDDCYNAGPESVKAALLALEKLPVKGRKILIFGDMYELGTESNFWHRQIGRFLQKATSISYVLLVGEQVKFVKQTAPVTLNIDLVLDWQAALHLLAKLKLQSNDVILVKGSTHGYTSGLVYLINQMTLTNSKPNLIKPAVSVKELMI